jgi:hypothetical protein
MDAHKVPFPLLSQMARDILYIPAIATDYESSFGLAKLALTSQRLSIGGNIGEAAVP